MLNLLRSLPVFRVPKHLLVTAFRFNSAFSVKDFQFEKYDGSSGTLLTRFIKHIAIENCENAVPIPLEEKIKYSQFYPIHDIQLFRKNLKNLNTENLAKLIIFTYVYKTNADLRLITDSMNAIDYECYQRLNDLNVEEVLELLYSFMYLIPNKITKLKFYHGALDVLADKFDPSSSKAKLNFVQIAFYMGLIKQHASDHLSQFLLRNIDNFVDELDNMQFTIIANASFKSATRIKNETFLKKLEEVALNENDIGLLVTNIKAMRMNRYKSDQVLHHLTKEIKSNNPDVDLRTLVHFFAYAADSSVKDPEMSELYINSIMQILQSTSPGEIRVKDISRFLWSCGYLNTNLLDKTDLEFIEKLICQKYRDGDYQYLSFDLIDATLSLWMLNFKSSRLMRLVLNDRTLNDNMLVNRPRIASRKKLLLTCVAIELPDLLHNVKQISENDSFDPNKVAPDYLVQGRHQFQAVFNAISKTLLNKYSIDNVKFTTQIKYLNIPGIQVEFRNCNRKLYLEVLDDQTSLSDGSPTGLMALKLRLLKQNGCDFELVKSNDDNIEDSLDTIMELFTSKHKQSVDTKHVVELT